MLQGMWTVFFGSLFIFFIVMVVFYIWVKKDNVEDELSEIVKYCSKVESSMEKGLAVFTPEEKDEYLYQVLVLRGILSKNPLGGYSMKDASDKTWGKIPKSFCSVESDYYRDDDGVMQVFHDDSGVKRIVTEEDIMKEKEVGKMKGKGHGNG